MAQMAQKKANRPDIYALLGAGLDETSTEKDLRSKPPGA